VKTQNGIKVSKTLQSLDCRGCTTIILCATESLKHVAKRMSAVSSSHVSTQLSVGLRNVCHICHGSPVTCTAMEYWLCHKDQYPSYEFASSGTRPRLGSCISDVHLTHFQLTREKASLECRVFWSQTWSIYINCCDSKLPTNTDCVCLIMLRWLDWQFCHITMNLSKTILSFAK